MAHTSNAHHSNDGTAAAPAGAAHTARAGDAFPGSGQVGGDERVRAGIGDGAAAPSVLDLGDSSGPGQEIASHNRRTIVYNDLAGPGSTTLGINNEAVAVDTAAGAFTVDLPALATVPDGGRYWVKNKAGGAANVTIDPDGGETIDGAATLVLTPGQAAIILKSAGGWLAFALPATVGFGGVPPAVDIGDAGAAGVAPTASRSDHEHPFPAPPAGYPVDADAGAEADGVATTAARSDHKHSVPTAAPVTVDKTANAAGVADTLARSDHKHDVLTAAPSAAVDIGDVAAEGVATSLARSDHEHAVPAPIAAPPAIAAASSIGVATTPARSDHTHAGVAAFGVGLPVQVDAGDAGSVGVAATASRSDHEHPVNTAVVGDLAAVDAGAASAGVSATLPRGDHKHSVPTAAPVTVDKSANAAGVATSLSRSDHKHDVSTAAPTAAVDIGDVAVEGVATSLARSDHQHAVPASVVVPPAIAAVGAVGVATTPARSDHTHAYASAALPTEILELLPIPEARVTGNATRVGQTVFDGASYFVRSRVTFNRIIFRVTAHTGVATLRLHIYQAPSGLSGSTAVAASQPQLVATISGFNPGGTGNFEVALDGGGSVTLDPGLIYVLWGRDSAVNSLTLQTYTTQSNNLLNTNVDTDTHPCSFTTAIAATTSPATFDPREAPSGAPAGTASDVVPIIRLRNV